MKYLDKYPNCIGCPVKKWCGTMISCIRLCKSYQENKTEMNYEERYKQAIEAAKRELHCCGSLDCDAARQIFRFFPELRESKDERIRKEILNHFNRILCGEDVEFPPQDSIDKWIAWLEKQGEKSWSEEDERILNKIQDHIREFYVDKKGYPYVAEPDSPEMIENNWLQSLKDRVQSKQEWSKEDEKILKRIDSLLYSLCQIHGSEYEQLHNWLKSLNPQNRWKPSEEQMSMLLALLNDSNNITSESVHIVLKSLYQDLLKL